MPSNSVYIFVLLMLARGITNLICNLSIGREFNPWAIILSLTILESFVLPKNIKVSFFFSYNKL